MSRIVLIHGFAVHLTAAVVRPPFGPSASMTAFDELVSSGDASVFPWGIKRQVSAIELLNPTVIHKLYVEELRLVHSIELQTDLNQYLAQEQPTIIVCHSMGCVLLQQFLEHFSLPASVTSIVLVQSDLPENTPLHTSTTIYHLYCPWDPTLLLSSLTHKKRRAGLRPHTQTGAHNKLFPLVQLPNLHTSSICDKKLVEFVTSLLKVKPESRNNEK